VPYGDTFSVISRYCITFVSPNVTKVVCHMRFNWKKQNMLKGALPPFFRDLLELMLDVARPLSLSLSSNTPAGMISKMTIVAMKEVVKDMGSYLLEYLDIESPAKALLTPEDAKAMATSETLARPGVTTEKETRDEDLLSPRDQALLVTGWIVSFVVLSAIISGLFSQQPDLSQRLAYALRCATLSSLPLPLMLVTGHDMGVDAGLYSRLTLFFVLNLMALSTFVEIGRHMNIIVMFSLYFLAASVALLAAEALRGLHGFSNPGILLCSSTVILLLLYNLGLSLFGQVV